MANRSQSRQRGQQWLLGCGNTAAGELGLGETKDQVVKVLRSIPALERVNIKQVASGRSHTLVLTAAGKVYSCGSNDYGQLGQSVNSRKPEPVDGLTAHCIIQVACGDNHSMALSEAGQVFIWGSNSHGQLADSGVQISSKRMVPKLVKKLAPYTVVQIAAGENHCMALLNSGSLFSWGANQSGQLGLGSVGQNEPTPQEIDCFKGLPLSQIECGGQHSLALSKSGTLLVWGSNSHGQLGLGDTTDKSSPTVVKPLRRHHLKYIVAGEEHSAVLTAEGGVFTFGGGSYGQHGHGSNSDQLTPRKVLELMGTTVTQIAAGRYHTVCYAPGVGRIFTFGLGGSGQLGLEQAAPSVCTPTQIPGKWVQATDLTLFRSNSTRRRSSSEDEDDEEWSQDVNDEFIAQTDPAAKASSPTGATASATTGTEKAAASPTKTGATSATGASGGKKSSVDDNQHNAAMEVDVTAETNALPATGRVEVLDMDLLAYAVFAGGDRTFLICQEPRKSGINRVADYRIRPKSSEIFALDVDILESIPFLKKDEPVPQDIMSYLEVVLSSPACMNGSFLLEQDGHYNCSGNNHGINDELALRAFKCLDDVKNTSLQEFVGAQFEELLNKVLATSLRPVDIEALRVYFLIPMCHLFQKVPDHLNSVTNPFQKALLRLKPTASNIVSAWYSQYNEHVFGDFVRTLKNVIDHVLMYNQNDTLTLELALKTLKKLNGVNRAKLIVPFEEFYIEILSQHVSIEKDYMEWQMAPPELRARQLFFCDYPFVFDASAKTTILMIDAAIQKHTAVQQSMHHSLNPFAMMFRQQPVNPYLVLKVRRTHLIEDSLRELSLKECSDLRKPLKVIFAGEEAVDEGGVRKEFFMLLIREILDPKFGMFRVYEDSNFMWFHPAFLSDDKQTIFLIGILCGLAIYNQTIIPLPFPLALYKKLLKEPVGLNDLQVLSPTIARGLQDLLKYEGNDVEDIFCLNFTVTRDNFGQIEEIELKPDGKKQLVSSKNRQEYVDLYVDYLFNKSCQEAFALFSNGFYRVLKSEILSLFNANELMTLVAGKENYDWKDLELHTGYKDEYNPTHPTIRMFWKVFHQLSDAEKKQFLLFLTGTDRIPILGMGEIKMTIQPMRVNDSFLPAAHTCYNLLDLPPYSSPEVLKTRLLQAIEHTHGFGLA